MRELLEGLCVQIGQKFLSNREKEESWNPEGYRQWLMTHFPVTFEEGVFDDDYLQLADIEKKAIEKVLAAFEQKIAHEAKKIQVAQEALNSSQPLVKPEAILREVVRNLLIRTIDHLWQDHLLSIDHLRTEVSLRAVGQKDPLIEFKHEAFSLFDALSLRIKTEIAHSLFKFEMHLPKQQELPQPAPQPAPRLQYRTDLSLMSDLE